jgi:hypothetical protein
MNSSPAITFSNVFDTTNNEWVTTVIIRHKTSDQNAFSKNLISTMSSVALLNNPSACGPLNTAPLKGCLDIKSLQQTPTTSTLTALSSLSLKV